MYHLYLHIWNSGKNNNGVSEIRASISPHRKIDAQTDHTPLAFSRHNDQNPNVILVEEIQQLLGDDATVVPGNGASSLNIKTNTPNLTHRIAYKLRDICESRQGPLHLAVHV